jgi:AcrR family transcriptional regulator
MVNTSETPALGKRARMKIERPQEILAAALREFIARGYAAARVEDIAQTVGVTKGTVYFYFDSKENLFEHSIRAFSPPLDSLKAEFDSTRPIQPQLRRYLGGLFDAIARSASSREVLHLLMTEGRHFPGLVDRYYEDFLTPALTQLRAMIEAGEARGEFRRPPLAIAELLLAPAMMANIWVSVFSGRRPLGPEQFELWQDFILAALQPDPDLDELVEA